MFVNSAAEHVLVRCPGRVNGNGCYVMPVSAQALRAPQGEALIGEETSHHVPVGSL